MVVKKKKDKEMKCRMGVVEFFGVFEGRVYGRDGWSSS